jgi:hypothetical protein
MLSDDSVILIFRLAVAILFGSLSLLGCFVGKLIKERSAILYSFFHTVCLAILLATSLCYIFLREEVHSTLALVEFSTSFLLLYVVKTSSLHSEYDYNHLINNEELEDDLDDEDIGIELSGTLPPALREDVTRQREQDNESLNRGGEKSNADSSEMNGTLSFLFFLSLLVMVAGGELLEGMILGSEKHADYFSYERVVLGGFTLSLVFGVVCEDAMTSSLSYVGSVSVYSFARPVGILVGNFFPNLETPLIYEHFTLISAGVYFAFVLFSMIPLNEKLYRTHILRTHSTEEENRKFNALRVSSFIFAFVISLLLRLF